MGGLSASESSGARCVGVAFGVADCITGSCAFATVTATAVAARAPAHRRTPSPHRPAPPHPHCHAGSQRSPVFAFCTVFISFFVALSRGHLSHPPDLLVAWTQCEQLKEALDRLADEDAVLLWRPRLGRSSRAGPRPPAVRDEQGRGQFDAAGEWALDGAQSTAAWLSTRCHLPLGEARGQLRRGKALRDACPWWLRPSRPGRSGWPRSMCWSRRPGGGQGRPRGLPP